jgi:hypothetical protein
MPPFSITKCTTAQNWKKLHSNQNKALTITNAMKFKRAQAQASVMKRPDKKPPSVFKKLKTLHTEDQYIVQLYSNNTIPKPKNRKNSNPADAGLHDLYSLPYLEKGPCFLHSLCYLWDSRGLWVSAGPFFPEFIIPR